MRVIDVSDPSSPQLRSTYQTPEHWAEYPFISDDYVYVPDNTTMQILRFIPETGVRDDENLPTEFSLAQNYPNPFNASTIVSYKLPIQSNARLEIYDQLGRKMATLINGIQEKGAHSVMWSPEGFSSGIYFYKLTAGEYSETRKCTLLK